MSDFINRLSADTPIAVQIEASGAYLHDRKGTSKNLSQDSIQMQFGRWYKQGVFSLKCKLSVWLKNSPSNVFRLSGRVRFLCN
jgi:hypothetical protein